MIVSRLRIKNSSVTISLCLAHVIFLQSTWGDCVKGRTAYTKGDFPAALREFRAGAGNNDARSQLWLGYMYFLGQKVLQVFAEAIKWFRLSADQGYAEAESAIRSMGSEASDGSCSAVS